MTSFCPECGSSLTQKEVDGRNRLFCRECSEVIWQNPKPVAWLLVQKGEEYLLVKRAHQPDKGEWDVPGGFLELEESFEEAAVRELEEETGVEIDSEEIEMYDTLSFGRADEHVIGVVFHAQIDEKPELKAMDDAEEARFWSVEDIEGSNEVLRDVCKDLL